jgi:multidrug resistance efflux pump
MQHRKRILIPIFILLAVGGFTVWYLVSGGRAAGNGALDASGTVEAVELVVAPELSGRVVEVLAENGAAVAEGDLMLRLDDSLLQAQRQRAAAALEAAQKSLVVAQAGADVAQSALRAAEAGRDAVQANTEAERVVAQRALDDLYENKDVSRAEAQRAVAAAHRAVREAQYLWDNYSLPTSQQDLTAAEAITMTLQLLERARARFEPYKYEASGNDTRENLKDALDEAQSDYDTAVRRMELEMGLHQAQSHLAKTERDLQKLSQGPNPDDVAVLEARLQAIQAAFKQARTTVEQAQAGVTQANERVAQAGSAVDQAQAELDWIDVQIDKLLVYAPGSGVVIARNIEPGEVVQAGAPLMILGKLDPLKITVYIPEDLYGQIKLGQEARVMVDSFPDETFKATVTHIADKAEFTPRNVQTVEGRKTTVFAIELTIENPDGRLKPGMPADVSFR